MRATAVSVRSQTAPAPVVGRSIPPIALPVTAKVSASDDLPWTRVIEPSP